MEPLSRKKILYSILSGLMLTASFPPGKLDWIVWFALIPLLKNLEKESYSHAFTLGLIAGLAHYLTLIYWILFVLEAYGGLHFLLSFGVLLSLSLYLAIYPALFSLFVCYIKTTRFKAFMMASLWVSLEYIRAKVLTGFPWCLLGYSQYQNLKLIQIANLVGVYGLSFLIVICNASIFFLLFDGPSRGQKRVFKWEALIALLMVVLTLTYGYHRISASQVNNKKQKSVKVSIIQGNIDQSIKWNPAYQEKTINLYEKLTRQTTPFKPHLIVWPETSVPFFFQNATPFSKKVIEISKESKAHLIFGSPAYRQENRKTIYHNRAYHLSPNGELIDYYDKIHLVPFGEYVPLKKFLPFVHRLVPAAGDFASGTEVAPLKLPFLSAGVLICFEVIFPELARNHAKRGAEILVNMTNDAWFGQTSAPYQHLSMAVFRAVENGKPLIRAANTGFSAFISPQGKIISKSNLFRKEILNHEEGLVHAPLSFYTRYGDIFALLLLFINLIYIFYILCYHKIFIRMQPT